MRSLRLLVLGGLLAAGLALPGSASATSSLCYANDPANCLTLAVSHSGDPVSASRPLTTAYFPSTVTLTNVTKKTVQHVVLADAPPSDASVVSVSTTVGSCTAGASIACDIGTLEPGTAATISVVFTSPSASGAFANRIEATFDESSGLFGSDPKRASVVTIDTVNVSLLEGAITTFLPSGTPADLSTSTTADETTSATRPQVAGALVPAQPVAETVVLTYNPAGFSCPKREVCRGGKWTEAHIANASGQPLQFELRWDASLVPAKQTVANFAVFYRKTLDAPTQVIDTRCDATASVRPCLKDVTEHADGDFSVVLVKDDNGYMR